MSAVTHIAGPPVTLDGRYLRQRCAWCGAILLDHDLARIAVPEGTDSTPSTWLESSLIRVEGDSPRGRTMCRICMALRQGNPA